MRPLYRPVGAALVISVLALCSCAGAGTHSRGTIGFNAAAFRGRNATPRAIAEAAREFDLGSAAFAHGFQTDALGHFQTALQLAPCAAVLFNLARVHEELRHDDSAVRTYLAYLEWETDPHSTSARDGLNAISRIASRVSWVVVRGDPSAAIDGETVSNDGVPMVFVDLGGATTPIVSPVTLAELHLASIVGRQTVR